MAHLFADRKEYCGREEREICGESARADQKRVIHLNSAPVFLQEMTG
jgi:hypothetical protein